MNVKAVELLDELIQYVNCHIEFVESLKRFSERDLQKKIDNKSWSVIECLEHINRYANFYNKEIKRQLEKSKLSKSDIFMSGYFGNKFALDMLPKDDMKKMKTFKSKNPIYSRLNSKEVVSNFLRYQKELLKLLELAKQKDLSRIKTTITLPLLKFRLGDTFRFVIYHNERHIIQAKKILN